MKSFEILLWLYNTNSLNVVESEAQNFREEDYFIFLIQIISIVFRFVVLFLVAINLHYSLYIHFNKSTISWEHKKKIVLKEKSV